MDTATVLSKLVKGQKILALVKFLRLIAYMWPEQAEVKDGCSYDFLVVGGGTAGCVIASELAKLNATVLLIEAGCEPTLESESPGLFAYLKNSHIDWNFTSIRDDMYKYHRGGVLDMQQGKVLGGSSQVNFLIYGKGIPSDYDKWAEITNDPTWRFKALCDIFKRIEKVIDKKILNSPDIMYHGTKGKIKIKRIHSELNVKYFKAYEELGQKYLPDINPMNTLGHSNAYTNTACGMRYSTAYSYLRPQKNNPNLSVIYNTLATEIVFDENNVAVGVKILTESNTTITVKAKKEVIVSAGAIKSPQLLMLSGIGPKSHLEEMKINLKCNLPVGQNFQDHPATTMFYKMGKADSFVAANPQIFPVSVMEGYVAIKENQTHADYHINSGVINDPKFLIQACASVFGFNNKICDFVSKSAADREVLYVTHSLLYALSRGQILLKDNNPRTYPIIVPGHYSNKTDRINHARFLKHYNRVLQTKFFRSVNAELIFPELEECEGVEKGSLEYMECYVEAMIGTMHMYYGTCSMGSVVDSNLKVMGMKNLRVADASVIPTSIGSTIKATTVMIAEKLIDILKAEYGLKQSVKC